MNYLSSFFKIIIVLVILLSLTALVYKNGLNGGFIFDDISSLSKLSVIDDNVNKENLVKYIGESNTGPLKRPISILSFLIDAQNWPTEAYSFKRTNLIIHLINGSLLYLLLVTLFKYKNFSVNKRLYIAGFSAFMWMAHPFLVSTTLYVVQRMAMLPLIFMLLGFVIYLIARKRYHVSDGAKGYFLMFVSVYVMTFLAVLSKENGIVFIWLVALFEVFIIKRYLHFNPLSKIMSLWLLKIPSFALLVIFIIQIPGFINGYDVREFNIAERFMSQGRAVSTYIYHLLLPSYFTEGVFTDGFKHSTGLLNPFSTFLSWIFLLGLITLAWLKRNKWVWFSFSILFFLMAQILESSIVPLELYFEHRVYIASMFLPIPLIVFTYSMSKYTKVYLFVPAFVCIILAGFTYMRTDIWSNNLQLHELTMNKYPESARVRVSTAVIYENLGLMSEAMEILTNTPDTIKNLELSFNINSVLCGNLKLTLDNIEELAKRISEISFTKNDLRPFTHFIKTLLTQKCLDDKTLNSIKIIIKALESNPNQKFKHLKSVIMFIKATVAAEEGFFDKAEKLYLKSFKMSGNEYESMNTAIMEFIEKNQYEHAQSILDYQKTVYRDDYKYKFDLKNIKGNIEGFQYLLNMYKNEQ